MRQLKVTGDAFQHADDSSLFQWAGIDGYSDIFYLLNGHNISDSLQERKDLRASVVRVFCTVNSFAQLNPKTDARIYQILPDYVGLLAQYGLYAEITHGDFEQIGWSGDDQYAHIMKLFEVMGDLPYFLEFNENEDNGVDDSAVARAFPQRPKNCLMSLGSSLSGGPCPVYQDVVFDYAGSHLRRDISGGMFADTCPWDMQRGYDIPGGSRYRGVGIIPVPHNEILAAGRDSSDTNLFFKLARMASPWNGMTLHTAPRTNFASLMLSPIERACAEAFFVGIF